MKTWRERIADARERGEFTKDDIKAIGSFDTQELRAQLYARGIDDGKLPGA